MKPWQRTLLFLHLLFASIVFAQVPQPAMPEQPLPQNSVKLELGDPPQCPPNKDDKWATPSERSCYRTTPRYDETMAYIRRIQQAAPQQVRVESFGKTGEGRDLWVVAVSRDGIFDPTALHKANRPIVYIQNSIHAGEMDGKDSCLALLRDILITKSHAKLIDKAVLLIIPFYNADGHERFGPFNRINQNGPEQMGWRVQSRNLNLNRDYLKAEAPETRAFLKLWNKWLPDFFIDDHVTDGVDYQYDTTYNIDTGPDVDPGIAQWVNQNLVPNMERKVTEAGHLISPYIALPAGDPSRGLTIGQDTPRFSTGYVVLQNRPALLVEMHMLKDYGTRVTGNYHILRTILEQVNQDAAQLVRLNRSADTATIAGLESFALRVEASGETQPFLFKGYTFSKSKSPISGGDWITYTKEPMEVTVPRQTTLTATQTVVPPKAYIIPAEWKPVIDVLEAHGVKLQRIAKAWDGEVELYRCRTPEWQRQPFEGHHVLGWPRERGTAGRDGHGPQMGQQPPPACVTVKQKMHYTAGSVVVPMAQRAAKVAIHWLEPEGPDSAMQWGYFDAIFEQKEYGETYVLEVLARKMADSDPKLKQEFDARVAADKDFAANSYARLNWWYQRSPWWDPTVGLYPVGRLSSWQGIPPAGAAVKPKP